MDLKCTTSQKRTYLIGFVKETGETEEVDFTSEVNIALISMREERV